MNRIIHRSTLYSSIIGAAGAVVAALIIAHGQREIDDLRSTVATRDTTIADMTSRLNACVSVTSEGADTTLKTQVVGLETQVNKCKEDLLACESRPRIPEKPPGVSPQTSESQGSLPSTSTTVEELGYSFSLLGCERSGSSVTCNLTIENQKDERSLEMSRPRVTPVTRLVDDLGNEVVADSKSLGRSVGSSVRLLIPKQVPIKASISFEGVAPEAKVLRLLEVGCVTRPEDKQFAVQFRNVQLH